MAAAAAGSPGLWCRWSAGSDTNNGIFSFSGTRRGCMRCGTARAGADEASSPGDGSEVQFNSCSSLLLSFWLVSV